MAMMKNTAGDALRQAFMSREDYDGLREEEKVYTRLQKPLCVVGFTMVWAVVVVCMMVMVDVVFAVSGQAYPFCQKRRLPSYDMADALPARGDLPSYAYTEEEAVDAFWLVAFLPTFFVFVFSTIYLFAGAPSSPPSSYYISCPNPSALLNAEFLCFRGRSLRSTNQSTLSLSTCEISTLIRWLGSSASIPRMHRPAFLLNSEFLCFFVGDPLGLQQLSSQASYESIHSFPFKT